MKNNLQTKIIRAGFLISLGTLLSRFLGFLRELLSAAYFGASSTYDAFIVAFSIPNLFRRIFGEEMFERAFLPKWKRLKEENKEKVAEEFLKRSFIYIIFLLILVVIILYILAPFLIKIFAPGFSKTTFILSLKLAYFLIPFMFLIGVATFVGAVILFNEKPLIYSLAPFFFNLTIIVTLLFLHKKLEIFSLAIGFLLGALIYALFQIPFMKNKKIEDKGDNPDEDPVFSFTHIKEGFLEGGVIFLSSLLGKSVQLVDRIVASLVSSGAISSLWFSFRIIDLPTSIISRSISRAISPELSKFMAKKDKKGFIGSVEFGIILNILLILPLTIFIMLFSEEIVSVVYKRGVFGIKDLKMTALPLFYYSIGLLPMGFVSLLNRVFSSLEKNKPTLYAGAIGGLVNIVLDFILYKTSLLHGGIALATSIAMFFNFYFVMVFLKKEGYKLRWKKIFSKILIILPFLVASIFVFLVFKLFIVKLSMNFFQLFLSLGFSFIAGFLFYAPAIFLVLKEKKGSHKKLRVLFSGGGTGGHVYPNVSIYQILRSQDKISEVLYVGIKGRVEEKVIPKIGLPIKYISSSPIYGKSVSGIFKSAFKIFKGMVQSAVIIIKFKPDLIVATGGYVSAPIVFSGFILKPFLNYKIVVQEQNVIPGLLNKVSSILSDVVMVSYKETAYFLWSKRCVLTGYPVREEFLKKYSKSSEKRRLKIPEDKKLILVFGGSLGSRAINRAIVKLLKFLIKRDDIYVVHVSGASTSKEYDAFKDTLKMLKKEFPDFNENDFTLKNSKGEVFYELKSYLHNLFDYEKSADLMIIRGGAGSISEALSLGKPAIIVPKRGLPNDHQELNAISLAEKNVARVVFERKKGKIEVVDERELYSQIEELLKDDKLRKRISKNAKNYFLSDFRERIVSAIESTINGEKADYISEIVIPEFVKIQKTFDQLIIFLSGRRKGELYYRYYESRIDEFLSSNSWWMVNKGIKLIGALRKEDKLDFIKKNFSKFNGFQRRNALISIKMFSELKEDVKDIVFTAVKDPYFEVRREAFSIFKKFVSNFNEKEREKIRKTIKKTLFYKEKSFEVKSEAIRTAPYYLNIKEFYEIVEKFMYSTDVRLREALVDSIRSLLLKDSSLKNDSYLRSLIKDILITTSSFKPEFRIREKYREVLKILEERDG